MFLSEVGAPMPSPFVSLPPPTGPTDPRNAAFHLTPSLRPRLRDAAPHTPCYAFRVSLNFLSITVQYASWALSNGRQLHHRRCIIKPSSHFYPSGVPPTSPKGGQSLVQVIYTPLRERIHQRLHAVSASTVEES